MASYLFCAFFHIVEMALESVHEPSLCLPHILHFAFFTSDAINQIVGFAGGIFLGVEIFACTTAVDGA